MLGWKLFVRALTLLVENLGEALRVSGLPYLAVIVLSVLTAGSGPLLDAESITTGGMQISGGQAGAILLNVAVYAAASLWIAVAWHRYVLLEERPAGLLPPVHGEAMLGYLGQSILIFVIVMLVGFLVSIPLGMVLLIVPPLAPLVPVATLFVVMILFYRLSIVLPARAVERPMSFGEAMKATEGHSGTVIVLALLTVGFSFLLQIPTMIEGDAGAITAIYQGVVGWIGLMIGVSTLTSLYGHLVEGRPVD